MERDYSRHTSSPHEEWNGQKVSQYLYERTRKDVLAWPLQSMVITQDKNSGQVEIERNCHATCPLYLLVSKNTLFIHWDPVELYPHASTKDPLDYKECIAYMNMEWQYGDRTVFKDISLLPERGRAFISGGSLNIRKPPNIEPFTPGTLKYGTDPIEKFLDLLKKAISRWQINAESTYAELSSGMDTTLVVHLLAEILQPKAVRTFGFLPLGDDRTLINERRSETVHRLSLMDYCSPIERHFDQAFSLNGDRKYWPYQTPTSFEKTEFASNVAITGGSLVFTGIGGDELCMLSEIEKHQRPRTAKPNQSVNVSSDVDLLFIPPELLRKYSMQESDAWPNGLVPESCADMANSSAFLYLRKGIWTAHPLALAELQTFAHFLPMEWRRNRGLSRSTLTRLGYSENFVAQQPKETLRVTMEQLMLRVDWDRQFDKAILFDYGLANPAQLQEAVTYLRKTKSERLAGRLMTTLLLELSLKSFHNDNLPS